MNFIRRIFIFLFRKEIFSNVGVFLGAGFSICTIISMLLNAFYFNVYNQETIDLVISDAFNLIFYLIVTSYFIKCKSNLYYGFYSLLLLIVSGYILPLIMSLIQGLFNLSIILPSLTSLIAVIYFAFIVIENKKRERKWIVWLKVFGLIFAIFGLVYGGVLFSDVIQKLIMIVQNGNSGMEIFSTIILLINGLLIFTVQPFIFAYYPWVLQRERYF